jgi:hypothetical protein
VKSSARKSSLGCRWRDRAVERLPGKADLVIEFVPEDPVKQAVYARSRRRTTDDRP